MNKLKGKTALITGAGKGLGRAMALGLAAEGVNLLLLARTSKDLENVASEARLLNDQIAVAFETADIGNFDEVQEAIKKLTTEQPIVDILINNAGIFKSGGLLDLSVAEWQEVFQVNLFGAYFVLREVLPLMIQQGRGDILNVASTAGHKGSANMSAYGASKAALINLSESVMQEARKHNIRVTTINPSTIATDMTLSANLTNGNPDRVLQPEDLAQIVINNLKLPSRAFVKEFALWSTNP